MAVKIVRQVKSIALLGAPTSAAGLAGGQEGAPAALRSAGLADRLTSAGFQITDYGDCAPRVYKSDEEHPRARNAGEVVSRAMLLQHVWDLHFDPSTNVIDVYVGRVRRKVDSGQAYPLIHTIRGVGFSLRAPE